MRPSSERHVGQWSRTVITVLVLLMLVVGPTVMTGPIAPILPVRAQVADWVIDKPGITMDHQTKQMSNKIIVESGGGLIIKNSTINFSPTVQGGGGILVQLGGSLDIYDSKLTSPNSGALPNFESHGALKLIGTTVFGFYGHFTEGGGVLIKEGTAQISGGVFDSNRRQGVTVFGGTVSIKKSIFKNNTDGVMCKSVQGLVIEDSTFYRNSQHGLVSVSCTVTVKRSTFSQNYLGVGLDSTTTTLTDSTIDNNTIGIDLPNVPQATIQGNKIDSNSLVGIRSTSSSPLIKSNELSENELAINLTGGSPQVTGNHLTSNKNGILAVGSMAQISGNNIGGSDAYGIYIIGGTVNLLQNNYTPSNGKGQVAWAWRMSMFVNKKTSTGWAPINGSTVEVHDAKDTITFYGMTNGTGLTHPFDVVEKYIDNNGATVSLNPYKISVSYQSLKASKSITVTSNLTMNVTPTAPKSSSLPIPMILLGIGVAMLAIAGGVYLHMKYGKEEKEREPRIKRGASQRRRGGRRALSTTATSRSMRVKKRRGRR